MRTCLALVLALVLWAVPAFAQFTPTQVTAIKAAIAADPNLNSIAQTYPEGATLLAARLNADAAPEFWVWKTRLNKHEVTDTPSPTGSLFSWTALGARSAGEQFIWRELWNTSLTANPSLLQVRQGFADVFSGGTGAAMRDHMLAHSRRKARYIEKILATGTGSAASPATMTYEGAIGVSDAWNIWVSP